MEFKKKKMNRTMEEGTSRAEIGFDNHKITLTTSSFHCGKNKRRFQRQFEANDASLNMR